MRWSNTLALFCCYCCFVWLLVIYVFCFIVCSFFKIASIPLVCLNFLNIHLVWLWDDQTPLLCFVVIVALTEREWHNPCFVLVQPNKGTLKLQTENAFALLHINTPEGNHILILVRFIYTLQFSLNLQDTSGLGRVENTIGP